MDKRSASTKQIHLTPDAGGISRPDRKLLQAITTGLSSSPAGASPLATGFIKTYNGRFVDDSCIEFIFTGWDR